MVKRTIHPKKTNWVFLKSANLIFLFALSNFFCDCSNGGAGVESAKRKNKETRKRNLLPTLHFWFQAAIELNVLGSKCKIIKIC